MTQKKVKSKRRGVVGRALKILYLLDSQAEIRGQRIN